MPKRQPRISVIVPCYNIAGYVGACLDALAAQACDSFEVVLVDDGSTDPTPDILKARAEADSRFRVLTCEHKGPSAARNAGLDAAAAPLVAFVDGDDVVSTQYLAVLEALLLGGDADIACCAHRVFRSASQAHFDEGADVPARALANSQTLSCEEALREVASGRIQMTFWGKLVKRSLIEGNPFPDGQVYEDLWNLGKVLAGARSVVVSAEPFYGYISRPGSITRACPAPMSAFQDLHSSMLRFEEDYRCALGLEHATDDAAYCLHLVHCLCGLHAVLQSVPCPSGTKAELSQALFQELEAARTLALMRGVPATHPQMLRALLLLYAPAAHDALLRAYRKVQKF